VSRAIVAAFLAACAITLLAQAKVATGQTAQSAGQSHPTWFVQGLSEYDRISHLEQSEKARQRTALLQWAKRHRAAFSCCAAGLQIQDARRGGAAFLTFLAQQFGDYVLRELQNDTSETFDAALANQTKPYELTLLFTRFAAWLSAPSAFDTPPDQFISVNGVKLQYVDWGGRGDLILFLPGLGDDIHRFDPFAPRFTNRWHVVGYSRRGQGRSEQPTSGYDTATLVEDLRAFLDAIRVDTVDLIGHSLAGTEMTVFATRYPGRVRHLVYLDAAYDMASARDTALKAHMRISSGSSPTQQLDDAASRTHLDFKSVRVPSVAFFALYDRPDEPPGIRPEFKLRPELMEFEREQVQVFRRDMARGEAIELRNTDHTFFNDPRIQASVVNRIRTFLERR